MNSRTSMAQRDDVIKRTVYVSDIDHQVKRESRDLVIILEYFISTSKHSNLAVIMTTVGYGRATCRTLYWLWSGVYLSNSVFTTTL